MTNYLRLKSSKNSRLKPHRSVQTSKDLRLDYDTFLKLEEVSKAHGLPVSHSVLFLLEFYSLSDISLLITRLKQVVNDGLTPSALSQLAVLWDYLKVLNDQYFFDA